MWLQFQNSIDQFQVDFSLIPWPIGEDIDLSDSLCFQTSRGLHATEDLLRLQMQLADIYGIAVEMSQKVYHIGDKVDDIKASVGDLRAVIASSGKIPVPLPSCVNWT